MSNKQTLTLQRPIGAKPSQEELEAQAKRAFMQKRNALAEGIIFGAVRNYTGQNDFRPLVDAAIDAADYYMEKVFSVKVTTEERDGD